MTKNFNKGSSQEELLKNYFFRLGFFTVRGVPFMYEGYDITDIDIWLYVRTPISRKVTIVDIKNKKTPQAIERIFWTMGLQKAIGADDAIVATTDKRSEVVEFGKKNNIVVLDGDFLSRLKASKIIDETNLLSEEDLTDKIRSYKYHNLEGNWVKMIENCKSILVERTGFDGAILLLEYGKEFSQKVITSGNNSPTALRLMYRVISYILISLDMSLGKISFMDEDERKNEIRNGLIYGSSGKKGAEDTLSFSRNLILNYAKDGERIYAEIRKNISESVAKTRLEYLVEYFSRTSVSSTLFIMARNFESLALSNSKLEIPTNSESKSVLYLLLDFWGIDRKEFEYSFLKFEEYYLFLDDDKSIT